MNKVSNYVKIFRIAFDLVDVIQLAAPLLHALHVRHDPAVLRPEQDNYYLHILYFVLELFCVLFSSVLSNSNPFATSIKGSCCVIILLIVNSSALHTLVWKRMVMQLFLNAIFRKCPQYGNLCNIG